ncbi:hypothetical protein [Micromonospora zhanjiangensis]|uniref:Pecanex-like protein 1 n=1 Tax=Micromonospora zhanjiangensis TaxID=1522057 RepID=A0ABV8KH44_9ACTN
MNNTAKRSARPRRSTGNPRKKRILAVVATLGVFGALVAITQVSLAGTNGRRHQSAPCQPAADAPAPTNSTGGGPQNGTKAKGQPYKDNGAWQHPGDGQAPNDGALRTRAGNCTNNNTAAVSVSCPNVAEKIGNIPAAARAGVDAELRNLESQITNVNNRLAKEPQLVDSLLADLAGKRGAVIDRINLNITRVGGTAPAGLKDLATCTKNNANAGGNNNGGNNNGGNNGGLDVLANNCNNSKLQAHDGFQNGNRCVSTAFGEVGAAAKNPSLLISQAPRQVRTNQQFTLRVSTRNLIRDRFLGAAAGGYYKESSLLNDQGLTRGHFHTACRMLNGNQAQASDPVPAFFVATEDGKGGAQPDEVTITIPGLPQQGEAQCAVWAGDGSHRIPMMERANQIPAFDVVRITVR